jgi:ABC-type dipeptide/oligopeptide/nickel transport system permease component
MIPTLIGISIITFVLLRLTGDPAAMVLGEMATEEALQAYREEHGLVGPIHIQYLDYMKATLTGDLGDSLRYRQPVADLLVGRLPATLELGAAALLLSLVIGIPVGIFSALRRSGYLDFLVRSTVLLGQAVPGFYLGILLIIVFAVSLGWFPTGGRGEPINLVLPTVTLGTYLIALVVRFTRSAMLDVLRQDYIRTARAKGLRSATVIGRHALKNAMIPLITVIGLQTAVVFSGAIVTETVFSWPGLGRFTVESIYARDFPVVQTVVLFVAFLVVGINLLVDIIYAFLDPRIHYE